MHHYLSILVAVLAFAGAGCTEVDVRQAPERHAAFPTQGGEAGATGATGRTDAQIINSLVELAENQDRYNVKLAFDEGSSQRQVLDLGSPSGYVLKTRYNNIGIPLAEALSVGNDPAFKDKLVTLARWDRNEEVRSSALIALASTSRSLEHLSIFNEALIHLKPSIRFGALEALVVWGHPDQARPLLLAAAERDVEPILRVYAASGLARLGDTKGLELLRKFLDDQNWIVRAMSARYLGDLGQPSDYDLLVGRIGRESANDFVVAEYCIASLKLFSKRS